MDNLYSIRMRASKGGAHISGAERIVHASEIQAVSAELMERAMTHERGAPDSVTVTVDCLAGKKCLRLPALLITNIKTGDVGDGRKLALSALVHAGVSVYAAKSALEAIAYGAAPSGGNMRGAMIIDAHTGARLEPDKQRGIRARAVDYDPAILPEMLASFKMRGLGGTHLREALALATKVAHAPFAVAKLCISDDPGYVTGYVASKSGGYVRITPLKESVDRMGGRAFFVDASAFDLDEYVKYMRETAILIS